MTLPKAAKPVRVAPYDPAWPAEAGYEAKGEYGIPGRRYFRRPAALGPMIHLHAFAAGSDRATRHLRFRDFLRSRPEEAARYGELKQRLAAAHPLDRRPRSGTAARSSRPASPGSSRRAR